jgi:ethanolamine utilization protein EutP (predicted NTPase)
MSNKSSKALVIAVAALTLTVLSTDAFSNQLLLKAGLTKAEQVAFITAHDLFTKGDVTAARDVLINAGVDEKVLQKVKQAFSHQTKTAAINNLSVSEAAAYQVALQANDQQTMKAILAEAGEYDL